MIIVLDSNILFSDPLLDKAHGLTVRDVAERLGYQIVLPQIVYDEAIQKRREQIEDAVKKRDAAYRDLDQRRLKFDRATIGDGEIAEAVDRYAAELDLSNERWVAYNRRDRSLPPAKWRGCLHLSLCPERCHLRG